MKAFSIAGSKHFVTGFSPNVPGVSGVEMLDYLDQNFRRGVDFVEGSSRFEEYRSILLRDADRSLLLAGSCFVRSLECLRPASSSWTVVGFYYSSFHAAHAVLAMLGCWIKFKDRWVDIVDTNPGKLKIRFHMNRYQGPSGSHKLFWKAYYTAVANLANWVPRTAIHGVTPMSSSDYWFIDLRNRVNYRPLQAFGLIGNFERTFDPAAVPDCFPGELNSAYKVAASFLEAAKNLAQFSGLKTDVFEPHKSRKEAIRKMVNGVKKKELGDFYRNSRASAEF